MNKNEFLKKLRKRLKSYPRSEVDEALSYYEEMVADKMEYGKSEEQAVAEFGEVSLVAASIAGELDGKYRARGEASPRRRRHSVAYWIFKPFAILFGIVFILIVLALWISCLATAVCLFLSALAAIVVGIFDVRAIYAESGLYAALAGGGAILAASGIVLLLGVFFQWLTRCTYRGMRGLCRSVFTGVTSR